MNSRRDVFKGFGAAVVAGAASAMNTGNANAYSVPDLPYPFEALEPHIDAPTMKIHHDKHHATYVANINKATEGKDEVPILDLMESAIEAGPAVRNNGGGELLSCLELLLSFLCCQYLCILTPLHILSTARSLQPRLL